MLYIHPVREDMWVEIARPGKSRPIRDGIQPQRFFLPTFRSYGTGGNTVQHVCGVPPLPRDFIAWLNES